MTSNESSNSFGVPWIRGQNKALLWALLIALTCLLLLYPVHLTNEYHSIQAPYLFDNLWLFGALFFIWIVILFLLLLLIHDNERVSWEGVMLACIFALVFIGFWVVITPYGSYADGIYNAAHVRYLVETGRITTGNPGLGYFDFPGMHLLVAMLSKVIRLAVLPSVTIFSIFNIMLFSALLYIFCVKLLKNNRLAFICTLMVIMGSIVLVEKMHVFTPGAFGFTFLVGLLLILIRSESKPSGELIADKLLLIILFAAMAISYFPTSFLFVLILSGIYIVQRTYRSSGVSVSVTSIILLLIIILSWEMYWTWHTFHNLIAFFPSIVEGIFEGDFLASALTIRTASAGAGLPVWAFATRYFWWILLGLETMLCFLELFRMKNLNAGEKMAIGGLLGTIVLSMIGLVGTEKGSQFARYLMYAPLFCAPILLWFLFKSSTWGRMSLVILTALILALSLPTFLSSVNTSSTDAIYSYECTTGKFLDAHTHEQGNELILFRISDVSASWAHYYTSNISYRSISQAGYYSKDDLWQEVDKLMTDFQNPHYRPEKILVLVISEKSKNIFQHFLNVMPNDPKWEELGQRLSTVTLIYDNGHVQLYIPRK